MALQGVKEPALTKVDMARVVVQSLFNLAEPPAATNVHVRRIARHKKADLIALHQNALKILAHAEARRSVAVFHVHRRVRPRGGNQFYRDRSERKVSTYCGAACTEFDVSWNEKAEPFDGRVPCEECMRIRQDIASRAG